MNPIPPRLDILVIAAHPDDAEISMGATITQLVSQRKQVGILDLSDGEPTPRGTPEIRRAETVNATNVLGVGWRGNLGLPNRSMQHTLEARKQLASVMRLCQAPWIFAPYWIDAHPDHVVTSDLSEAARFWAKLSKTDMPGEHFHPTRIYHYYSVHLKQAIQPAFIVDVTDSWDNKMAAVRCYPSQFDGPADDDTSSFYDRLDVAGQHWGHLIGTEYGEPFTCREPIGLTSLDSLF